ncbi:MAG: ABC transporter substrate-binding protein, partial [Hungatella sp.]|nr:ABC transporter substrate-binding protein [Hungatella sp.]
MMKKLIALGLTAAMAASLAACGGNGGSDATTAAAGDTTAAAAEDTTAAADDSGAAAAGGAFKIGVIGPLTGPAAAYGIAVQNGADLAVKEINAAGGAGGIMLEMNAQDDEHDPQKSVNAYNTLKDWGAQAIVGSTTSDPCIAVAAETSNDNMFQITPS